MSEDLNSLAALPSLGPASAQMLIEAGVRNGHALKRLGAEKAFRALRFTHGRRATVNFIYALDCAIRNLDWRALEPERKAALRAAARAIIAELAET